MSEYDTQLAVPWKPPTLLSRLLAALSSRRAVTITALLGFLTALLTFGQSITDTALRIIDTPTTNFAPPVVPNPAPTLQPQQPLLVTQMVPAGTPAEYYFYNIDDAAIKYEAVIDPVDTITYICEGTLLRIGNSTRSLRDVSFARPGSDDIRPIGVIGYGQYIDARVPDKGNALGEFGIYEKRKHGFVFMFVVQACGGTEAESNASD